MSEVAAIGLDQAKNVFQVHGADGTGAPGEADEQHRPVAQVVVEVGEHGAQLVRPDRILLRRWPGVTAADAGEDG